MNILLINHYAGSNKYGMEYRPFYLAREWVRMGHDVTILAASFSHLRSLQPEVKNDLLQEKIEGIRYVWLKTPPYKGNGIKRIINMLTFITKLILYKNKIAKNYKPDVIIASSTYPLDIYPAYLISRKTHGKLIYEVHDLWPLSPIELGGMSPRNPYIIVMQIAENFAYRKVDKVVSLLPKAYLHMEQHGMAQDKFVYIPNGIDVEEWKENRDFIPKQHCDVIKTLKERNEFIVCYAGGHGLSNALSYLIDAASLLKEKPVSFILVGQGPEKDNLMEKARRENLNNIYFLPPIKKTSIPQLLSMVDALYIGWNRKNIYKYGISPNKLIDYMMSGKPIIHAIEAGNDPVAESSCGISIPPENPQAIADAVIKLMNMNENIRKNMGNNGRKYVLENNDYKILARKFCDIVK